MNNGKSPGLDGIPVDFVKVFLEILKTVYKMKEFHVYGVSVACETLVSKKDDDLSLGVIVLEIPNINLVTLRTAIIEQVDNIPKQFGFLTPSGCEIKKSQEPTILLSSILSDGPSIRIIPVYDQPKVGIWHRCNFTEKGHPLGFVFVPFRTHLTKFRSFVTDQLGDLFGHSTGNQLYCFLDRNGWPIKCDQERRFCVVDLLNHGCVHVYSNKCVFEHCSKGNTLDYVDSLPALAPSVNMSSSIIQNWNNPISGPPVLSRQGTLNYEKESPQVWSVKNELIDPKMEPKQVLLSYVRNEASEHATVLKKELTRLGYSVFLDVDEIKSGIDWQDSLNFAVAHCEIFVPLVTPHYGETQWTNREVKLADVLQKLIIPVSFIDQWPPRVLAIQFATTQFVPWKPQKALNDPFKKESSDFRIWEVDYIQGVAKHIAERLKEHGRDHIHDCRILKKVQTLKSCPAHLPDGFEELSQNRDGRPLIVISVHPQQRNFVISLKSMLESKGFEVWCTIELEDEDYSESSDTQLFSQDSIKGGLFVCSQQSGMSWSSDCDTINKNLKFQEKVDAAGVILVVLSKSFAMSKTCKQQVFYCEHRKKIIPIKYDNFCMPGWISMLIGTGILEDVGIAAFEESLSVRVKKLLNSQTQEDIDRNMETVISQRAKELKDQMPEAIYTYISGGTQFYHDDSKEICKSIGKYLAKLEDVHLVTGGFQGVGETVGLSYKSVKVQECAQETIWHVLPVRDSKEKFKAHGQKKDGTFVELPYGKTLFSGNSVRERESIVSRVFDICILVEGGPGAAHEAEQFVWNDHVVIPVKYTGGAAGGKFNVPERIFELPCGVSDDDWNKLQDSKSTPEQIGKAVASMVTNIKNTLLKNERQKHLLQPRTLSVEKLRSQCSVDSNKSASLFDESVSCPLVQVNKNKESLQIANRITNEQLGKTLALETLPSFGSECLLNSDEKSLQRNDTLIYTELKSKQTSNLKVTDNRVAKKQKYVYSEGFQYQQDKEHQRVKWNITDERHTTSCIKQPSSEDKLYCKIPTNKQSLETSQNMNESSEQKSTKRRADHHKSRSSSCDGMIIAQGSPKKKTRQNILSQNNADRSIVKDSSRLKTKEKEMRSVSASLGTPSGKMRMHVQL